MLSRASRFISISCFIVLIVAAVPAGAKSRPVARLGVGDGAFWSGPFIEDSAGGTPTSLATGYSCENDPQGMECFDYEIVVRDRGRLRVAIDTDDGDDYYYMRLRDASGRQLAGRSPLYSAEVYANVQPGTYTVRVEARNVRSGRFRMRAKLELPQQASRGGPRRALLPNLRLLPPFKFTFETAAYTPAGAATGCAEDEIAEHQPVRCLRFSLGPANFGDGPLELRYEALEGVVTPGTMYQRIHFTDGSTKEREAGEFEYHTAHGHFHHAGFGSLELHKVVDPKKGLMRPAGEGPKQGFCMAPYAIVEWRSFDNDPAGSAEANCLELTPATGTHMGLEKGWADIYEWYLSGNYVDFGDNEDGLYVVRSMTDAGRDIKETDESDNWSYAYIRVAGDEITVLERGYGRSPWDPDKIVEPVWLLPTV